MEGTHCYDAASCDMTGLVLPVYEYAHGGSKRSVTGGSCTAAASSPATTASTSSPTSSNRGPRSFVLGAGQATRVQDWDATDPGDLSVTKPSSFGQDHQGELYIVSITGDIYKIVPAS